MGEILDSGERREFESGAVRDIANDKGRMDLVPLDIIADFLAQVSQGEFLPLNDINFSECYMFDRINLFIRSGHIKYIYWVLYLFIKDRYDEEIETAILDVSIHYQQGAKKYKERNWEKGIDAHCYVDSALRHGVKYFRGDNDEPHDRAFMWNLLGLLWTLKHKPELNDLPYNKKEEVKKEKKVEVKVAEVNVPDKNGNIVPEEALKDAITNLDKSAIYKYFPKATHSMITIKATMNEYEIEKIIYNDISNFDILKVLSFSEENTGEEPELAYKVYGATFGSCGDIEFSVNPEEYDADFLVFILRLLQYNTGNPNKYYDTLHYRFLVASSEDDKTTFEINVTRIEVNTSTEIDIATEVPVTTTNSNGDVVELHLDKTSNNDNEVCINKLLKEYHWDSRYSIEDIHRYIDIFKKAVREYISQINKGFENTAIGFEEFMLPVQIQYFKIDDYRYFIDEKKYDTEIDCAISLWSEFGNQHVRFVFKTYDDLTNFKKFCELINKIEDGKFEVKVICFGFITKKEEKKVEVKVAEANVLNKNSNIIPEEVFKDAIVNLDKSAIYKYFPKATHPMITIKATMDKYVIEKIIYNDISNFDILEVFSFSEGNTGEEPKLAYKVYGITFGSCGDVEFSINPEKYDADFLVFIRKLQHDNIGNPNKYYDTLNYRFFITSSIEDDKSIFEINVTRIEIGLYTGINVTEIPITTADSNEDIENNYIESKEKKFKVDYTELELYENYYPDEKRYQLSDDYGIVLTYNKKDMEDYFDVFISMLQIFIDINSTHENTVIGIENFTKYHHILKYVIGNEKMFIKNGYRFIIDCEIAYKGHYYLNRVRFLFNEVNSQFEELCKYFIDHEQDLSIKITYGHI